MTALIEAGAEINLANRDGETPLHWAAMTGTFLAVKALADAGADLNAQDGRNRQHASSRRGFPRRHRADSLPDLEERAHRHSQQREPHTA